MWGGYEDGSCPCRLRSNRSIIDWLVVWQEALQKIRQKNTMRREVTVELSSQGFWKTGIRSDVCQVTPVSCARAQTSLHVGGARPWSGHAGTCAPRSLLHMHGFAQRSRPTLLGIYVFFEMKRYRSVTKC